MANSSTTARYSTHYIFLHILNKFHPRNRFNLVGGKEQKYGMINKFLGKMWGESKYDMTSLHDMHVHTYLSEVNCLFCQFCGRECGQWCFEKLFRMYHHFVSPVTTTCKEKWRVWYVCGSYGSFSSYYSTLSTLPVNLRGEKGEDFFRGRNIFAEY